jgi:hypothetical protein
LTKEIKIGDWVKSYSKGIYRIERIFDRFYDESSPCIPEHDNIGNQLNSIVLLKRLLNSKFEKSIGYESCNETFIFQLNEKEFPQLKKVLIEKPQLIQELDTFEIPVLKTVYNYDLQIDNKKDLNLVKECIAFIKKGKSFLQINNEMERLDILRLKPKHFGNYKLQLFNFNEEYIDKRKIWRDATLHKKE